MKLITVHFLQRELHSFTKQGTGTKQNSTTCLKMSLSKTARTTLVSWGENKKPSYNINTNRAYLTVLYLKKGT